MPIILSDPVTQIRIGWTCDDVAPPRTGVLTLSQAEYEKLDAEGLAALAQKQFDIWLKLSQVKPMPPDPEKLRARATQLAAKADEVEAALPAKEV